MAYNRANIRQEVRDYLAEAAEITAGIWTDAQLNRFIAAEIRGLPAKGIYLQSKDTSQSTAVDTLEYSYPSGVFKIDMIERNWGTASKPDWLEEKGWKQYGSKFYLPFRPTIVWQMRLSVRKSFSQPDDTTATDVPDEKIDVVVVGTALRALKRLAAYLSNVANWDSISKPDGVSISSVSAYIQIIAREYKDLVNENRTPPMVRDIDLVG